MQKIPISLAEAGMVLAKDVRKDDDSTSPPICGKGVVLTDALISRLDRMGIQALAVEGHPVKMEGDLTLDEMLKALEKRFSKVTDDPLMVKIKEAYGEHFVQSMKGQDAGPEN